MYKDIIQFIRKLYVTEETVFLHAPHFGGNEKRYLAECIDSTYVSSVGKFVDRFEEMTAEYTGAQKAVVCVNGTNALHLALLLAGVERNDEVITQALTFVATCNAISYIGAHPVFVDIDKDTMGLSPAALEAWLKECAEIKNNICRNKKTGKRIKACVPMHTFGHPVHLDELTDVCKKYHLELVEDAAESIGSFYCGKHTGTFGKVGVISFNGNKTITTGGGGMLLFNDKTLGEYAKHLTTQAKVPHRWEFAHNEIGYNYRMPNINAALGCAQIERIDEILANKRETAMKYKAFFETVKDVDFFDEPANCKSNFWLNAIILKNKATRDNFLQYSNDHNVMTRPV
ncbi:MAG: LegC family aminotransferase, partial [Prevotellaceae bacterium]|nr:LegC family aminotransferase [Prevotellaceae bacterium]